MTEPTHNEWQAALLAAEQEGWDKVVPQLAPALIVAALAILGAIGAIILLSGGH